MEVNATHPDHHTAAVEWSSHSKNIAPTGTVDDWAAIFQSRKMTTKYTALAVLLYSVVLPRHVAGGAETGGVLVFRDARVFDGAQVLPRATVLVRNGRIVAVGDRKSVV